MASRRTQKYCPECGKQHHPARKLEKAIAFSKMRVLTKPVIVEKKCLYCGKLYTTSNNMKSFCSRECQVEYRINNTYCAICGAPMRGSGDEHYTTRNTWTCSDTCALMLKWKTARENGTIHTCIVCGKEFIENRKYCSDACKLKAKSLEPDNVSFYTKRCQLCNKVYRTSDLESHYCPVCTEKCKNRRPVKSIKPKKSTEPVRVTCSACYNKFIPGGENDNYCPACWEKKKLQLQSQEEPKKVVESLCISCKTPYSKCERMKTKFKVSPEGCEYDGQNVIYCPKYT